MPRPANAEFTKPFWDGTKRHELVIPHCDQCDKFFWHPQEVCPRCLSSRFSWQPVSGRGRVYGYTTIYQSANPAFANDGPYVYACIQLDEGARMVGNLVGVDVKDWHSAEKVNTRVEAVFDDASPDWTFVRWRPVAS
jgi:uncharacterized OB-fold protein